MITAIQTIFNGLLIGGVYALIAVGLTMIFGVLKIVNLAQGEFVMIGMYATFVLFNLFGQSATSYMLLPLVAIIMLALGAVIMIVFIRPVLGKGDTAYILITSGLSFVLQNLAQGFFTANYQFVKSDIKTASLKLGGIYLSLPKVIAFFVAVVLVLLVSLFLKSTDTGRAIRSVSIDRAVSQMLGVNVAKMYIIAFSLGVMFAGISGCLLTPIYSIYPRIGTVFSTTVFAVVVLGGLGNIKGAFFGGLLVGVVENFVGTYYSMNLAPAAVFLLFIVVMLLRPDGLFAKGGARKA